MDTHFFVNPKKITFLGNEDIKPCLVKFALTFKLDSELANIKCNTNFIECAFKQYGKDGTLTIIDVWQADFESEEYSIEINGDTATIKHNSASGFYYALQTLVSLVKADGWQNVCIYDKPSIKLRGALLDIGRDKIPTFESIKRYIEFLSALRYNHFELYMEGFSFDYTKYRYVFAEETPITADEFTELTAYAKSFFIDLVPNQNCLGHMEKWIAKPQFKHMAECPDGFMHHNLYKRIPTTFDVNNEKTLELADYMMNELLSNSTSKFVNVNLDEPFELGTGVNKELCDKIGKAQLYLNFIHKVHKLCKTHNKRMMMWGDVLFNHKEIIDEMPKDIILLDWCYEGDASFENNCKFMQNTGIDYCLCPGTSAWASFAGRSDNMVNNVNDAVKNAVKYKAMGVIMTDWGDLGHWQYFSFSKPAFICAGQAMWSGEQIDLELARNYANFEVFEDKSNKIFDIMYNLGNYYKHEYSPVYSTTLSFSVISSKYPFSNKEEFDAAMHKLIFLCTNLAESYDINVKTDKLSPDIPAIKNLLQSTLIELEQTDLSGENSDFLIREIKNTVAFINHGITLYYIMKEQPQNYKQLMAKQYEDLDNICKEHYELWFAQNRSGGFEKSSKHLQHLLSFYAKESM